MQFHNVFQEQDLHPYESHSTLEVPDNFQNYIRVESQARLIDAFEDPEEFFRDDTRSKEVLLDFYPETQKHVDEITPIQIRRNSDDLSFSQNVYLDLDEPMEYESNLLILEIPMVAEMASAQIKRSIRRCRINKTHRSELYHPEEESSEEYHLKCKKSSGNETKNIPKNFGKAVISFIEYNKDKVERLLIQCELNYDQVLEEFKLRKKSINTIADLRNIWTKGKYCREMRILSNLFLRKYALEYIFNSRIMNYNSHIKYRQKLREALKDPDEFRNIKDY